MTRSRWWSRVCLLAPAVLSLGCSNQSLLTTTNLNSNPRAETVLRSQHHDDDDVSSIFGARSQAPGAGDGARTRARREMRPGVWSADHGAHHDINTSAPAALRESRALPGYISNCDMAPPSGSNGILRQRMKDRNTEGLEVIITSIPARGKDTICLETAR